MRFKLLFAAVAVLALLSCRSQWPLMVPEADPGDEAVAKGWLNLADGTFHEDEEGLTPEGYYVKGWRKSWETFHPTSEILGTAPPLPQSAKTQPAWLELDDGSIHPMQEAVVPRPPYVRGYVDQNGRFHPDPKKIIK